MNKEKISTATTVLLGILSLSVLFFLFVKFAFPVFLPFLVAWGIAMATSDAAARLSLRIRVPRGIIRLMMSLFILLFVFGALAVAIRYATTYLFDVLREISEGDSLSNIISVLSSPTLPFFDGFPVELAERISEWIRIVIGELLSSLSGALAGTVGEITSLFLFVLVCIISLVYFSLDLERINASLKGLVPKKYSESLARQREGILKTARKYVLSYLLIMAITFAVILTGLMLLGVKGAFGLSLFIAVLDVLPVIGVGTVLIPWSIFALAAGNHYMGIGLIILFVTNTVIRQLAEPKIIGKSLGLHPLLAFAVIYVGYELFGLSGVILLPLLLIVFSLYKNASSDVS